MKFAVFGKSTKKGRIAAFVVETGKGTLDPLLGAPKTEAEMSVMAWCWSKLIGGRDGQVMEPAEMISYLLVMVLCLFFTGITICCGCGM